jgi:molybdate transport system ATP-binding protein
VSSDVLDVRLRLRKGALTLDVAFDVKPGLTILFGPSGAGKSTILAAIAGLVTPVSGRIAFGTRAWFDRDQRIDVAPEERGVSLVFQSLALFPHLTALGNVEYGIDRAVKPSERQDRARAMLDRMKVPHVADRRPSTFSGGEAQRVALARAFARDPKIVLLDEAFSAMDRELRHDLGAEVRVLVEKLGIPALLVTHNREEALRVGDSAVLLRDGKVAATGPVRDVVPAPEPET